MARAAPGHPLRFDVRPNMMDDVTYFETSKELEEWLEKNHQSATELVVGFHKAKSETRSISWPESVDLALCFGWIDGVRKRIDQNRYQIRFTPRKKKSIWSSRNLKRFAILEADGKVRALGAEAFSNRSKERSKVYSYEQIQPLELENEQEAKLRENHSAWLFYQNLPPSYRRKISHWIASAKMDETRQDRFSKFLKACEQGKRL
jgi:uncharacterized protein YdeI (YjbR/CyaY-like superfamily)